MGVHVDVVRTVESTTDAIDTALDLSTPAPQPLEFPVPADYEAARNVGAIAQPIGWWLGRMASGERLVEERLVWFWHDHFATSIAKVRIPYLMWQQHLTLREHATGNFGELLHAMARDPAMILYLDGITNAVQERNENFGRECLELFTMGRDGGYTQNDVIEASRSFTGWVVNIPGRPFARALRGDPWTAVFLPQRHDAGSKTLLGTTGAFDMDGALDVILANPSTARFVAREVVPRAGRDHSVTQDDRPAGFEVPARLRDHAAGRSDRARRCLCLRRGGARKVPDAGREARWDRAGDRRRRAIRCLGTAPPPVGHLPRQWATPCAR